MSDLTPKERAWLRKVQQVLDECPRPRLGFDTLGDRDVIVYDRTNEREFEQGVDFCHAVERADADFNASLRFPAPVHSTSG